MQQAASAAEALNTLKATGVRLAIDDFGTGYSSLSYLTQFPVDSLKLDRSFVHNIGASSDHAIVASAVIRMGKSLNHKVIGEGIETPAQLAFLQAHDCDEGQGFYFSQPVTASQCATLLETGIAEPAGI